jgi:uncharacterized membrane protein YraQ (UPF0718 family)
LSRIRTGAGATCPKECYPQAPTPVKAFCDDSPVTVISTGRHRLTSTDVFCAVLVLAVAVRFTVGGVLSIPSVSAWVTVFAAICIQASPYIALGVFISTVIAVCIPPSFFTRVLPSDTWLAIPVAGLAGAALPGCECGSVPVAATLMRRGVPASPAVAFLLSAPAINPVVLVATSVAFPGEPRMVLARALASLLTALATAIIWQRIGRGLALRSRPILSEHLGRWQRAHLTASRDLAQALGLLVIGAASAALVSVAVPLDWMHAMGGDHVVGVLTLALLAVVLAVCSEADAFIAASLTQFSSTARLAFMVVGPAVDLKLVAMQAGTFGRRFTVRFAPLTLLIAVVAAALVGGLML